MPKALMGMAVVTVDNSIWIFGGLTRGSEGSSIEDGTYVFDPRMNAWINHSPMTMKRAFASAVSMQRDIWLVGGIVHVPPCPCQCSPFRSSKQASKAYYENMVVYRTLE
ncbi:beta-scruin-like [Rhipicephalus microplus]|uniref:beta-scruin-like n=1 Tax=Rhipicephalus microplus TaxID=6941 RepID=UPI003F6B7C7C